MKPPYWLCLCLSKPNLWSLWYHVAVCVFALIFVRKLMRWTCCLCVCICSLNLNFFSLCGLCRNEGKWTISFFSELHPWGSCIEMKQFGNLLCMLEVISTFGRLTLITPCADNDFGLMWLTIIFLWKILFFAISCSGKFSLGIRIALRRWRGVEDHVESKKRYSSRSKVWPAGRILTVTRILSLQLCENLTVTSC
jgi:hypothetical protein